MNIELVRALAKVSEAYAELDRWSPRAGIPNEAEVRGLYSFVQSELMRSREGLERLIRKTDG